LNDTDGIVFQLELKYEDSDYQVRPLFFNDEGNSSAGNWVRIADRPHAFKLEWWGAWSSDVADGYADLWVDNSSTSTLYNLDNDTQVVDRVRLGIVSGAAEGTAGVVYFDGFVSDRANYIYPDPNGPAFPANGFIFGDGFETGNAAAWKGSSQTCGSALNVSADAAIYGSWGLKASAGSCPSLYLSDIRPYQESAYNFRFYLDPNSIVIPDGHSLVLFQGLNEAGSPVLQVELTRSGGNYFVRPVSFDDAGNPVTQNWQLISDAPHAIKMSWGSAGSNEYANGYFDFAIDSQWPGLSYGIDNDTLRVDEVRLGIVSGATSPTQGTIYLDEFESRRSYDSWPEPTSFIAMSGQDTASSVVPVETKHAVSAVEAGPARVGAVSAPVIPVKASVKAQGDTTRLLKPVAFQIAGKVWSPLASMAQAAALRPLSAFLTDMSETNVAYAYDPLGRLTAADYGDGIYFHYTYDAVGNRLTETTPVGTTTYTYDAANRLATVNGVAYTWDNNGNLLSDGTSTYTYNHANRLNTGGTTTFSKPGRQPCACAYRPAWLLKTIDVTCLMA
jgi:YD repeat-containing protein